jgi:hypothetical protein
LDGWGFEKRSVVGRKGETTMYHGPGFWVYCDLSRGEKKKKKKTVNRVDPL